MKSALRGKNTSAVEVTGVLRDGFRLRLDGREVFLSFDDFPWFRHASAGQLRGVERPHPGHLRWPELDVDLAEESIEHPGRFPLVSRTPHRPPARRPHPRGRRTSKHARPKS